MQIINKIKEILRLLKYKSLSEYEEAFIEKYHRKILKRLTKDKKFEETFNEIIISFVKNDSVLKEMRSEAFDMGRMYAIKKFQDDEKYLQFINRKKENDEFI